MRLPIPDAERAPLACFIMLFSLLIVLWATLHDLMLIRIEPRHFTEFHPPLLPLAHPILLAIQYAIVASLGPAMLFGALAWAACRRHSLPPCKAAALFAPVLLLIEFLAHVIAFVSVSRWQAGASPIFPKAWYPELESGIIYTQSASLATYPAAVSLGGLWLLLIYFGKRPQSPPP